MRVDDNRLDVTLHDAVLAFCNLVDEDDTLVGFDGTPWHSHGIVMFGTGEATYVEYDELDILIGLGTGDLLIFSQLVNGVLRDRWLAHKTDVVDDPRHMQPGEEIRIYRLGLKST
jgi:hypothetical protein